MSIRSLEFMRNYWHDPSWWYHAYLCPTCWWSSLTGWWDWNIKGSKKILRDHKLEQPKEGK